LIHMKMTGHLLYGKFRFEKTQNKWLPSGETGPLHDPYNKYLHVVFALSNNNSLAFSDARKFGKIVWLDTETTHETKHLSHLGPEPLDKSFTIDVLKVLKERLKKKPRGKVKTVLMDQSIISGVGNIYSDEILWHSSVHPERLASSITPIEMKKIYKSMRELLTKGIDFGGDSMSDYRNIEGLPGKFQLHHEAYRRAKEKCRKRDCSGKIERKVINGRSAHFCNIHQK
jgi:formamidopyrimidine-DNA glycosylase